MDHYGLVEIKKKCSRNYNFWNTFNTSLGNLGFKIIQSRLLIEDLLYINLFFIGGPVVIEEDSAFNGLVRFVLIGTVHGAFSGSECSSDLPGIFVETDNLSVLKFLYKEAYGKGL